MRERPILFSGPMVRAILEGRKTQTRRVVTAANSTVDGWNWNRTRFATLNLADPKLAEDDSYRKCCGCFKYATSTSDDDPSIGHRIRSRWEVGDRLWVREVHWRWGKWVRNGFTKGGRQRWEFSPVGTGLRYMENPPKQTAKRDGECGWVYRHSRFMFRAHSRITLELTDVRVQRVQEIGESDAIDEGAGATAPMHEEWDGDPDEYRKRFRELWDSINGKTHPWSNNDWVWALTFKVVQP